MSLVTDNKRDIIEAKEKMKALLRTKAILKDMPTCIKELDGFIYPVRTNVENELTTEILPITVYSNSETVLQDLKTLGFIGFRPKYNGSWWAARGSAVINGISIVVDIGNLPTPPKCHLEEYTETVTRFRAVCEEDSEDVVVM